MFWRWVFIGSLWFGPVVVGQSDDVLKDEPARAENLERVSATARRPSDDGVPQTSRLPEVAPVPDVVGIERSGLQPMAGDRALIDGQWVSPQLVIGSSSELPRSNLSQVQQPALADESLQGGSKWGPSGRAAGLDDVFEGNLVKRYSEAKVVRFLAPRESIENLFEQIGLDDLNRYQFRRNRPDSVPVERPR